MYQVMPKHTRKQQYPEEPVAGSQGPVRGEPRRARDHQKRSTVDDGRGHERHGIPRWRKIEIMRERAQLREALGGVDLFDDFDEFEEEVFGSEEEYEVFYRHSDDADEDEISFEDDGLDDDELEDIEDD